MKLVYGDEEKDRINLKHEKLKELGVEVISDEPNKVYNITFEVTDPAIAEYIITGLLYGKLEDFDIGIKVKSLKPGLVNNAIEVRQKLYKAIEDIVK